MKISAQWIKIDQNSLQVITGSNLGVKVDNSSLEVSSSGVRIKNLGVKANHIDFGTSAGQVSAQNVPVIDSYNVFQVDDVNSSLNQIATKMILYKHVVPGFKNVLAVESTGSSESYTLHPILDNIPGHNNGGGTSTNPGIVLYNTRAYDIPIRWTSTQDPVSDENNNEVAARLSFDTALNKYKITYVVRSTNQPFTGFKDTDRIDFAYVLFSQRLISLPWADVFVDDQWIDAVPPAAQITDNMVAVDGMQYLLAGATTQAQVNYILDKLGSIETGEGANLIKVETNISNFYGTSNNTVSEIIGRIRQIIGGVDWNDRGYSYEYVVSNSDTLTQSIDKLDSRFKLLSESGAPLVGIVDNANLFSSTNVEGALYELATGKRNVETIYLTLTSTDITNGYRILPRQVYGTSVDNVVTSGFILLDCLNGGSASDYEFKIMRNDSGTTDFVVWKNNIAVPGCTNSSTGINSTDFGDLLEAGFILRLSFQI